MNRNDLNDHLETNSDVLRNEALRKAFHIIDRADFVGADYEPEAYEDYALPLGFGETMTKPTIIAFMFELLDIKPGDNVLEVGAGSGWVIALISEIVGKKGKVTGVEIIPEFVSRARTNIQKYNFPQTNIVQSEENKLGHVKGGPYDKILCTSTALEIPHVLIDQLKSNGTLVMPIEEMIVRGIKKGGVLKEESFPGTFNFERLI